MQRFGNYVQIQLSDYARGAAFRHPAPGFDDNDRLVEGSGTFMRQASSPGERVRVNRLPFSWFAEKVKRWVQGNFSLIAQPPDDSMAMAVVDRALGPYVCRIVENDRPADYQRLEFLAMQEWSRCYNRNTGSDRVAFH